MSYLLRHRPDDAGLVLDAQGWADVDLVLAALASKGSSLTRADLARIVAGDDKRRYALSEDGTRVRANQGHSVDVELDLPPAEPPSVLYHGTAERALASILATGLERRARHHVHLSAVVATARAVGGRHGRPVVLRVDAARMRAEGWTFYRSANDVWLVDAVPAAYLAVEPLS